ncbi:Uncharacterised protein [Anaerobiospirillum thomasii]|nr:Uncharacterised protein [Anaerobiospirillum thomasii]
MYCHVCKMTKQAVLYDLYCLLHKAVKQALDYVKSPVVTKASPGTSS